MVGAVREEPPSNDARARAAGRGGNAHTHRFVSIFATVLRMRKILESSVASAIPLTLLQGIWDRGTPSPAAAARHTHAAQDEGKEETEMPKSAVRSG